ncbi:hypothetical protein VUR80DRAFT_5953 [Thermomyces stellatus]
MSESVEGAGTTLALLYVIVMDNLRIGILPHATSALLLTIIFSARQCVRVRCVTVLYSLSLELAPLRLDPHLLPRRQPAVTPRPSSASRAPRPRWRRGSPAMLSSSQIIDYIVVCVTYLFLYRALKGAKLPTGGSFPTIRSSSRVASRPPLVFYGAVVFVR